MSDPQDFVPVRVTTLRPGVKLGFDVFVHYDERYLHYRRTEETFEEGQIEKFVAKKVKKVFIPSSQEPAYLSYLESALDDLAKTDVAVEERAEFAAETMRSEAENIGKSLETEEGFQRAQNRIGKVIDFVANEKGGLRSMLASAGISVDNSQHSSTVASLSLALASRVGLTDREELVAISLAALIHDTGLAELGLDPMLPYDQLSKEKRRDYWKHPQASVDLVSGKKYITPRVLRLVADHEEAGEGVGFPEKKWINKLPLSSQVFNLCDAFDHYSSSQGKSAADAFDGFAEKLGSRYLLEHVAALEMLIKQG